MRVADAMPLECRQHLRGVRLTDIVNARKHAPATREGLFGKLSDVVADAKIMLHEDLRLFFCPGTGTVKPIHGLSAL
jgi:hypothetical protein